MTHLLKTKRFLPLFITQFLGAFNDNVFKNALVMFVTFKVASASEGDAQTLVIMAGALFILPYFLFSATAGQMADKYDRAFLARATKIWEMIIVSIGAVGFVVGNAYFLLFVLFCLGIQSTFFGPIKYALLPQHLKENELLAGNAYIEAGTFLAILLGTIAGGLLIMAEGGNMLIAGAMISCALGGYMTSRVIPQADAPMPSLEVNWNIPKQTWDMVQHDRKNRRVFLSILGISWFWVVGAAFLSQFPAYAKDIIGGDETVVTLFLTLFSIGVGIGSLLSIALLKGEVKSTYAPWAAGGIALFSLDLFWVSHGITPSATLMGAWQWMADSTSWRVLFDMLMIAVCGGLYVVPLYAIMQHESEEQHRARTIATNNVMNALFMVLSSLVIIALLKGGTTIPQLFLCLALCNGVAVVVIRKLKRASPKSPANGRA